MKTRNFYILVSSIIVGMVIAWLFVYTVIVLDVDLFQDPNSVTIRGSGVNRELTLTITELKSDKYDQVIDKTFNIKKGPPSYSEYDIIYSGVSLWSILEVENLIYGEVSLLKFEFKGRDLYISPKALNLSIMKNNPELVIIAYEENGDSLSLGEGPLRSVLDQSIMPNGEYSSQYSVQKLSEIIIKY
jgi:hypothetical protein